MNQVSRENAKTSVKKNFHKLVNNSNFGYDCGNNANNCFFAPIFDELEELSYAKRIQNLFDLEISEFVSSKLLESEIDETMDNKIAALDQNETFFETRKNSLEVERKQKLDSVYSMRKSKQMRHEKKNKQKGYEENLKEAERNPKTKSLIEFDTSLACSVKALAVKQGDAVKPTSRFFSGKMLMFAKISLISSIYDLVKTFFFPNKKTIEIYEKYQVDYIYPFHNLMGTDSTSILFLFACSAQRKITDEKYRYCLFEVFAANDILHRFDKSHEFWEKLSVRDITLKKMLGYYEIEHIDDPCEVTVAMNPKEYIKKFQREKVNKKHKSLKTGTIGMESENFAKSINTVREIETFGELDAQKHSQFRFSVKNNSMVGARGDPKIQICTNR